MLVSSTGLTIIDWENASIGSPLADVARTLLAYTVAPLYVPTEPYLEPLLPAIARFKEIYLGAYLAETGADLALIDPWRIPIAAARLHEGIEVEEQFLPGDLHPSFLMSLSDYETNLRDIIAANPWLMGILRAVAVVISRIGPSAREQSALSSGITFTTTPTQPHQRRRPRLFRPHRPYARTRHKHRESP